MLKKLIKLVRGTQGFMSIRPVETGYYKCSYRFGFFHFNNNRFKNIFFKNTAVFYKYRMINVPDIEANAPSPTYGPIFKEKIKTGKLQSVWIIYFPSFLQCKYININCIFLNKIEKYRNGIEFTMETLYIRA